MGSIRTAGAAAILAAGLLSQQGCQNRRQPAPRASAQPSLSASHAMREKLMRADPSALVGLVTSTLPDVQLVAVREVPAEEFAEGDTVQFIDGNGVPLTTGTVERIMNGAVHVTYASSGGRAPNIGDLVVRTGGAGAGGIARAPADAGGGADAAPADGAAAGGEAMDERSAAAPDQGQVPANRGGSRLPPRRSAQQAGTAAPTGANAAAGAGTRGAAQGQPPLGSGDRSVAPQPADAADAATADPAPDTTAPDAAAPDAAAPDAATPDAAAPDPAAPDAPAPDAGTEPAADPSPAGAETDAADKAAGTEKAGETEPDAGTAAPAAAEGATEGAAAENTAAEGAPAEGAPAEAPAEGAPAESVPAEGAADDAGAAKDPGAPKSEEKPDLNK